MPWSEGILVTEKAMCLLFVLGAEKAKGFPCGSVGKESTCNAGDLGSIPRLEKKKDTHSSILARRIPQTV